MRMWHKYLIPVLPREQLVAQWRELSAIAGNILTRGTPNHILVNPVMDYDLHEFVYYANWVRSEMSKRGYRTADSVIKKIHSILDINLTEPYEITNESLYSKWMDKEYLTICFYNLKEKYLRGGIREEDWKLIEDEVAKYEGFSN